MPIMAEIIAENNTAPAATSLLIFASGCISGLAKFTVSSIAVLTNSKLITIPKHSNTINHSIVDISNINPPFF